MSLEGHPSLDLMHALYGQPSLCQALPIWCLSQVQSHIAAPCTNPMHNAADWLQIYARLWLAALALML